MWRTPAGLFGIPDIEQVGVGLLTALVAISLAVGCAHEVTRRTGGDLVGSVGSLTIRRTGFSSIHQSWAFRPFAVGYAMLPVLILGLLSRARAMAARPPHTVEPGAEPSAEPANAPFARDMLVE